MSQVISIGPDGAISGLQVKPGKGFDLRQLGKAQIVRASEILWDEWSQAWYVQYLSGPHNGNQLCIDWNEEFGHNNFPEGINMEKTRLSDRFLFDDYDDAVKAEIKILDAYRLKGLMG